MMVIATVRYIQNIFEVGGALVPLPPPESAPAFVLPFAVSSSMFTHTEIVEQQSTG